MSVRAKAVRARFAGFAYFDGDAAFCVDASFEPAAKDEKEFKMQTLRAYQRMDLTAGEKAYAGKH